MAAVVKAVLAAALAAAVVLAAVAVALGCHQLARLAAPPATVELAVAAVELTTLATTTRALVGVVGVVMVKKKRHRFFWQSLDSVDANQVRC